MPIELAVLIGIILGAATIAFAVYFGLRARPAPPEATAQALHDVADVGALRSQVENLAQAVPALQQALGGIRDGVQAVEAKVVAETARVKDELMRDLQTAKETLTEVRGNTEARRRLDNELQQAMSRIEAVIAGHERRGEAGEQILGALLRQFPAGMIDLDYRVNGKPVEFALVLPDGRRLPIDSKLVATDLLQRLAQTSPGPDGERLADEIERSVQQRLREVAKYISPPATLPWAVAAVPDPAYAVCRKAHLEAHQAGVILIPYSLVVPYLLTLYRLYLQYASTVDVERLNDSLVQIERCLGEIDQVLENKVIRAATMAQNAYNELKKPVGAIRGAVASLRSPVLPAAKGAHADDVPSIMEGPEVQPKGGGAAA